MELIAPDLCNLTSERGGRSDEAILASHALARQSREARLRAALVSQGCPEARDPRLPTDFLIRALEPTSYGHAVETLVCETVDLIPRQSVVDRAPSARE